MDDSWTAMITHTHTHTHTLSLSLIHTLTLSHIHPHPPTLFLTHTHTLSHIRNFLVQLLGSQVMDRKEISCVSKVHVQKLMVSMIDVEVRVCVYVY